MPSASVILSPPKSLHKKEEESLETNAQTVSMELDEGQVGRKSALKSSGQEGPSKSARAGPYNFATTPVTSVESSGLLVGKTFPPVPVFPPGGVASQSGVASGAGSSEGPGGKSVGKEGGVVSDEEPSMKALMLQMKEMSCVMTDRFSN